MIQKNSQPNSVGCEFFINMPFGLNSIILCSGRYGLNLDSSPEIFQLSNLKFNVHCELSIIIGLLPRTLNVT